MISPNALFLGVKAFVKVPQNAFMNNREFNTFMNKASTYLFEYYCARSGQDKNAEKALLPFYATKRFDAIGENNFHFGANNQFGDENIRKIMSVLVRYPKGSNGKWYDPNRVTITDRTFNLTSPVRGANADRGYFLYEDTVTSDTGKRRIVVYPEGVNVDLDVTYLREPPAAARNITINVSGEEEFAGETQLIWGAEQYGNLVDIIVSIAGIATRDNEIVKNVLGIIKPLKDGIGD